ncbi:MAG: M15 family metallopeptidase [Thiobacillaceae bacterium]|jgi:LysM repeat protein
MARTYTIKKGDTLTKIARAEMGDVKLAKSVSDYNGLPDAKQIFVGQRIELPSRRDMTAPAVPVRRTETSWPAPPHGFQAICDMYGNILKYIRNDGSIDPKWEAERMVKAALPFSIPLSWNTAQSASAIRCHKIVAPIMEEVFRQIAAQGLKSSVKTYGGCYVFRAKRGQVKPSAHSRGIAIDLNPNTNAMGTASDMDPRLVELFEHNGFTWGGRWTGRSKDPMHFQYCSGY